MALAATTVWEVRTAGSDTACSGGFVAGGGGTDYSQQNAAQYNGTNLVIDGTTNTLVSSATHNFVAADVGNLLRITAGTGFTTGFFQIVSVAANKATLDRSAGTLGSTAGTFYVGGALATPGLAVTNMVGGNAIYASGGYTTTTDTANAVGGPIYLNVVGAYTTAGVNRFIGYTSARGDGGKYTVTLGAGLVGPALQTYAQWNEFNNVAVVGNSTASAQAATFNASSVVRAVNIKVSGFTGGGAALIVVSGPMFLKDFEISGGNSAGGVLSVTSGTGATIMDGWVHGNAGIGVNAVPAGSGATFIRVQSAEHTGGNGYGFFCNTYAEQVFFECVAWNNAQSDWRNVAGVGGRATCIRCVSGGGAGYNWDSESLFNGAFSLYYCASKANTAGLFGGGTPLVNVGMVTLTGDPFTNRTAGDFSPNNTAGAGAALRGVLETIFGLTTTAADIGPAQHVDSVVAPTYIRQVAMRGGGG